MSTFRPCDYTDCPAHPEHETGQIQEERSYTERTFINSGTSLSDRNNIKVSVNTYDSTVSWADTSSNTWVDVIDASKITPRDGLFVDIQRARVSIECFACKHFEKCDMRELLIVERTKKELKK